MNRIKICFGINATSNTIISLKNLTDLNQLSFCKSILNNDTFAFQELFMVFDVLILHQRPILEDTYFLPSQKERIHVK